MQCLLAGGRQSAVESLRPTFEAARFSCAHVTNSREALATIAGRSHDLIVLASVLDDMPAIEFLRGLRRGRNLTPVIVAGPDLTPHERIEHLEAGADEVFATTPSVREIQARVRQLMVRQQGQPPAQLIIGPIEIDIHAAVATFNGQPARLPPRVYAVLEALALRKGQRLSREQLIGHLYEDREAPDVRAIDVFICTLRRRMLEAGIGNADAIVQTVRGHGFILREDAANMPNRASSRRKKSKVRTY